MIYLRRCKPGGTDSDRQRECWRQYQNYSIEAGTTAIQYAEVKCAYSPLGNGCQLSYNTILYSGIFVDLILIIVCETSLTVQKQTK